MSCLITSFAMNCDAPIKSMRGGHELPAETMEKLMRSIEEIMGLRHVRYPLVGAQFHPESIMTDYGHELLDNFLRHEL